MKIQEIFDLAVKMGIESDFRGKEGVQKVLDRKKKNYEALPIGGILQPDENASEIRYFKELPKKVVKEHKEFLKNNSLF
jgi:hypothetical protein